MNVKSNITFQINDSCVLKMQLNDNDNNVFVEQNKDASEKNILLLVNFKS